MSTLLLDIKIVGALLRSSNQQPSRLSRKCCRSKPLISRRKLSLFSPTFLQISQNFSRVFDQISVFQQNLDFDPNKKCIIATTAKMLKVGRIHNADHQPPLHLDVGGKKGGRKSPDLTPAAAPGSQWDLSW